ncbi:hypothetical protein KC19_6G192100 [Ceratodon purpureus]|uniref:Uncharacterized protein n=1 Tax=Ceratodon purpureus TaxID=3225 RepID=A0A8T0HJ89_CERPU|nr:hypothetical protein KC19_6G192100 [Ceratodon purpureus]
MGKSSDYVRRLQGWHRRLLQGDNPSSRAESCNSTRRRTCKCTSVGKLFSRGTGVVLYPTMALNSGPLLRNG